MSSNTPDMELQDVSNTQLAVAITVGVGAVGFLLLGWAGALALLATGRPKKAAIVGGAWLASVFATSRMRFDP